MRGNERNDIQREYIGDAIRKQMKSQKLSLRKLENKIHVESFGEINVSYTQISRVTNAENYTIDTLLTICDSLGLEIEIVKK